MSHFEMSLIATVLASGLWLAQLATSFPLIRVGCVIILIAYFLLIAIDAFIDKTKATADGYDGPWIVIVTPHIGVAVGLLFLILTGVWIGW